MFAGNWFNKNRHHNIHRPLKKGLRRKKAERGRSLRVETLEDRRMLATFVVNNGGDLDVNNDIIVGSLRQAIALANATPNVPDTIVFDDSVTAIALNGGQLNITDTLTILGPGAAGLTITNTIADTRIFNVDNGDDNVAIGVTIGGVTLTGGNLIGVENNDTNRGGAILTREVLTLVETEVVGNSASQGGGGIFAPFGSLTVARSVIDSNTSGGGGGGIFLGTPTDDPQPFVNIVNSTITGNNTFGTGMGDDFRPGYGGGVFNRNGTLNLSSSTVVGNSASSGLGAGVASFGNPRPGNLIDPVFTVSPVVPVTDNLLSLEDNEFETITELLPTGNPNDFGAWQGDTAGIVLATPEVSPNRGLGMLQFLTSSLPDDPDNPDDGPVDNQADIWQLVDFSPFQALFPDAAVPPAPGEDPPMESPEIPTFNIEFQALFNTIAQELPPDADSDGVQYEVAIQLHDGATGDFDPNLPVLPAATAILEAPDNDSETWELISTSLQISNAQFANAGVIVGDPAGFDITTAFLAVRVSAIAPGPVEAEPFEFAGHFADSANIIVDIVPTEAADPPPTPVSTVVDNTIIFDNIASDIDVVGTTGGDEPLPLVLSITSNGSNLVGAGNVTAGGRPSFGQVVTPLLQPVEIFNQLGDILDTDPVLSGLGDFGGSVRGFHPLAGSPIIDASLTPSNSTSPFGSRGRHFTRVFGLAQDIGAIEAQLGTFVVDSLEDELDSQTSPIFEILDITGVLVTDGLNPLPGGGALPFESTGAVIADFTGAPLGVDGDFSLREALRFSELNPFPDTILFEPVVVPDLLLALEDPTPSAAPTILATLADTDDTTFRIFDSVNIIGPTSFELEIDTAGTDATPGIKDNQGTRLFEIDNGDDTFITDFSISNLTLAGGDVGGDGGSILNSENLTITNSRLRDNASSSQGGAIFTSTGQLILDSSALFDNSTSTQGGAVFVGEGFAGNPDPTRATIRNSTISGNTSDFQGAGVFNEDGEVIIEYSTITNNSSPFGAGVVSAPGSFSTVTLVRSSIIAGNNGGEDINALFGANNFLSGNFNIIGQGNFLTGGGNATDFFGLPSDTVNVTNPGLAPLADIGGLTFVHSLLPGSPAIDAGNPFAAAGIGNVPQFDQRGGVAFNRIFDGLQNSQAIIDIGAFELQSINLTVSTLLDENDGVITAGNLSLREAIEIANANPLPDTIDFDPILFAAGGQSILQSAAGSPFLQVDTPTDLRITDSVEIIGPGADLLELDGSAAFVELFGINLNTTRFFTIDDRELGNDINVEISGVTFANSTNTFEDGGAIWSSENLLLRDVELEDNSIVDLRLPEDQENSPGLRGGAIFQQGAQLTLDNSVLTGNRTEGVGARGGAVFILDGELVVLNQTSISGNSTLVADSGGAGIFAEGSDVRVERSYLTGNITEAGDSRGAALYALNSDVLISDFSFIGGNSTRGAQSRGAGFYSLNSDVGITDAIIVNNSTIGTFATGAAISSVGGNLNISNSNISNNATFGLGSDGGGIAGNGATIVVEETTIAGNSTAGEDATGGGFHNLNGDLTILSSLVTGNSANDPDGLGGGVANETSLGSADQRTRVINSTVSGNFAGGQGGGLFNASGLTQILNSTVTNNNLTGAVPQNFGSGVASFGNPAIARTEVGSSIIAGNVSTDVDSPGSVFGNSFVSLGFNLIGNGSSLAAFEVPGDPAAPGPPPFSPGGDLIGVDPLLGPLTANGGPTQTHALLENSPAINAGSPIAIPLPSEDQRDFPRIQDTQIDIGAFESIAPVDFTGDGFITGLDFLAFQLGFDTPNASQANGDANGDGQVDNTDLGLFQQGYGNPPPEAFPAVAASFAPPSSEPSAVSTVLASSQAFAGLSLSTVATSNVAVADATLATASNVEVDSAAKDDLFATFASLTVSDSLGELGVSELAAEDSEDLDPTIEDQLFELLGAGA